MTTKDQPPLRRRRNYKPLVEAVLAANGDWVRVRLDEIGGSNRSAKVSLVHQAGYNSGFCFRTTVVDGFMYVRLREPKPVASMSGVDDARIADDRLAHEVQPL